jgi:putative pyruvate formate lyase activating enzyme
MTRVSRKEFLQDCGATFGACLALRGLVSNAITGAAPTPEPPRTDAQGTRPSLPSSPGYLTLHRSGELKRRADALWQLQEHCTLCPRQCGARRLKGERGFCGATSRLEVAAHHAHFGEEQPLVGRGGSGTIFLTHCSLRCVFCINASISHGGEGRICTISDLADMMLALQARGCHNINLVTPTHYAPHILRALDEAARRGLRLPLVYNTSGWERPDLIALLDGIVDIYLPDMKYADEEMADRYSAGARGYVELSRRGVLEMHRQVGVARPARGGLMNRGLMIRHLVMPNGVSGTRAVLSWIAANLPADTYVNLMSQYRPAFRAREYPAIGRPVSRSEYEDAVVRARKVGLTNLDLQGSR